MKPYAFFAYGLLVLIVLWLADLVECGARSVKEWSERQVRRVDEAIERRRK